MSKIYYGRKKYVPLKCPICKKSQWDKPVNNISDLLSAHFTGYWISCDKDKPGWIGYTQWYGECGQCAFLKQLTEPSWMDSLPRINPVWTVEMFLTRGDKNEDDI